MKLPAVSLPFRSLPVLLVAAGVLAVLLASARERTDTPSSGGNGSPQSYTVRLGANGFSPAELVINVGDAVEFVLANPEAKFFWPASDFHPTHAIYPEFDPGEPIPAGTPWRFTVSRAGTWGYHDHLAPYFTGRITVRAGRTATDCAAAGDAAGRENCWNLLLSQALKRGGTTEAFATLTSLYRTEPAFIADGCHRQAHVIGEAAYAEYRAHGDWSRVGFGPETIYCNYGYYHGIFEHLFRDHPSDLHMIEELCSRLEAKLSNSIPLIRRNCFHGAGHGFMADPPPASAWGDPAAMLSPALRGCERLAVRSPGETQECFQGAYNVLADRMNFGAYGLRMPENPIAFCAGQGSRDHQLACYYEYAMRLHDLASNDITMIAERFVDGIGDDVIARMVIDSAASTVVESTLERERFDDAAADCRDLTPRLREPCLNGIVGGLVAHGEPGREYEKVLLLCASQAFGDGERNACYRSAFSKFHQVYAPDRIERLCREIPAAYRIHCSR